jgi:hypothetical protein
VRGLCASNHHTSSLRTQGPIAIGLRCWNQAVGHLALTISAAAYGSLRSQGRRKLISNAARRMGGAKRYPSMPLRGDGYRCAPPILRKHTSAFSRRVSPEVCKNPRPKNKRAQGMPGACCTRGLVCNSAQRARTRAYRSSRNTPAFPAQWLYGLYRALVSAKSARMCERAVLTNRPSLDLSPFALKGL